MKYDISPNRVLLLKILPGLGKSHLGKTYKNFLDYEDWVESKGLKYKQRRGDDVINDLETMVSEISDIAPVQDIYICSSIAWEDFGVPDLHSVLYVYMNEGEYNCDEVKLRNREDLCEKFGDRLLEWNISYGPMKPVNKWRFAEYKLHSGEMLNKNYIVGLLAEYEGHI